MGVLDSGTHAQSFDAVLRAFSATMVGALVLLMVAEFATGVALAIKENRFDWSETVTIAKKLTIFIVAWGAAYAVGDTTGKMVYGLILAHETASVTVNLTALLGVTVPGGIVGQLLGRGAGDGSQPEQPPSVLPPKGTWTGGPNQMG